MNQQKIIKESKQATKDAFKILEKMKKQKQRKQERAPKTIQVIVENPIIQTLCQILNIDDEKVNKKEQKIVKAVQELMKEKNSKEPEENNRHSRDNEHNEHNALQIQKKQNNKLVGECEHLKRENERRRKQLQRYKQQLQEEHKISAQKQQTIQDLMDQLAKGKMNKDKQKELILPYTLKIQEYFSHNSLLRSQINKKQEQIICISNKYQQLLIQKKERQEQSRNKDRDRDKNIQQELNMLKQQNNRLQALVSQITLQLQEIDQRNQQLQTQVTNLKSTSKYSESTQKQQIQLLKIQYCSTTQQTQPSTNQIKATTAHAYTYTQYDYHTQLHLQHSYQYNYVPQPSPQKKEEEKEGQNQQKHKQQHQQQQQDLQRNSLQKGSLYREANSKHIDALQNLSQELTKAYSTINELKQQNDLLKKEIDSSKRAGSKKKSYFGLFN